MDRSWKPYVPVAQRRRSTARELKKLGRQAAPVVIEGRTIARTFWGKAWCENLERYSDYSNRLPRGRTYVRNGSVVDLALSAGKVAARVSGSSLYSVSIVVSPLRNARWKALCKACGGGIDSVVELLQGRFAKGVMERLCGPKTGLFPSPAEIRFSCSCPDWASMCKHVAACLYGVGARLDHSPELFFTLRQVDQTDLIATAGAALALASAAPAPSRLLDDEALSELFGVELGPVASELPGPARKLRKQPRRVSRKGDASNPAAAAAATKNKKKTAARAKPRAPKSHGRRLRSK